MMGGHSVRPSSFPGTLLPPPGTVAGNAARARFIASLLDICGDTRALWLPSKSDTTTTTDASRNGRTFTYDATIASRISIQGSGLWVAFDGTDDEADVPDNVDFTWGDGTFDQAFSIAALVKITDATPTAANTILARWNKDTDGELREWRAYLTATNGYPTMELYDESANAYIGRADQTALTADTATLLGFTYDGSGLQAGINVFRDAVELDDANSSAGSYVAMEDLNQKMLLGHTLSAAGTPVAEEFWTGSLAFVVLCAKELSADDHWRMKSAVNAFYGLSL